MDGAQGLMIRDAWDLAIYLHAVTDTKQYQGLEMEYSAVPRVCTCLLCSDCTLKKE